MDGRGGCYCLARNATKGVAYYHDVPNMDRIKMLKFRPIAPKPATSGPGSVGSSQEVQAKTARRKRSYVRETNDNNKVSRRRRRGCGNERRKGSSGTSSNKEEKITSGSILESDFKIQVQNVPNHWINFIDRNVDDTLTNTVIPESMNPTATAAASQVIVECMTETWAVWDRLGHTDEERITNLESDTCPGFVSNLLGLVTWTNGAMRKMLGQEGGGHGGPVVSLLAREAIPDAAAFTCRVRVQGMRSKEENKYLVVPCDAWRMDCGGYAWRLDVEAALRLGR